MAKDIDRILDAWGRQASSRLEGATPPNSWMAMVHRAHLMQNLTIVGAIAGVLAIAAIAIVLLWPDQPREDTQHLEPPTKTIESDPTRMLDGVPRLRDDANQ